MYKGLRACAAAVILITASAIIVNAQTTHDTTGPYKVVMEEDHSLPGFTVYHPENVSAVKEKLPILAWGNGACLNAGNSTEPYLSEIASHGYLVVAIGPIDPNFTTLLAKMREAQAKGEKPGPPAGEPPPMNPITRKPTKSSQLNEAIDWAIKQNSTSGSPYKNKIATDEIGVSGTSCGGLQAIEAAADPRVKTALLLNTGIIRDTSKLPPSITLPAAKTESLKKLHTPVIYIIGGPTDIAYNNADLDYTDINHIPLFRADINVGHGGTSIQPHGGKFADVMVAWLNWQLKHDKKAAAVFTGEKCGLCSDSEWTLRRKNFN
ncbi:MAG TPA: hypothetical protein VN577_08870 [Terriglobales bacterium]|nr:hypothetical protein [Terriglobales bacterium]